jgi:hypothetical protein
MSPTHLRPASHVLSRTLGAMSLAGLLFAATACAAPPSSAPPAASPPKDTASLSQSVRAKIGDATCKDSQQCRTIAWGNKACGGPESYLAWSTQVTDEKSLQELATAYANARRAQNEAGGMMSTCQFLSDPGAQCVANRCVLNPGGKSAQ